MRTGSVFKFIIKKYFALMFITIIAICSLLIIYISSPQMRYNVMNLSNKKSYPVNTDNPDKSDKSGNSNSTITNSLPENTLTPASSIYYSESNPDSNSNFGSDSNTSSGANSSSDSDSDSSSSSGSGSGSSSGYSSSSNQNPDIKSNPSSIKNTLSPSSPSSVNASPEQIIETVNSFIMKSGIFNNISIKLIDHNVAESNGTFTTDIDTLIKEYPPLASYKPYLKLAAGRNVYATTRVDIDKNNHIIPSFVSLYIGIIPISTGFINEKLKDKSQEFTDALKTQMD